MTGDLVSDVVIKKFMIMVMTKKTDDEKGKMMRMIGTMIRILMMMMTTIMTMLTMTMMWITVMMMITITTM